MEAVNEAAKNVAMVRELIKQYAEINNAVENPLLVSALELLDKTIEVLTKN